MTFKAYAISIATIVLISAFGQMILPEGKLKKSANVIFSIILVAFLVVPIAKLDLTDFSSVNIDGVEFEVDESAVVYIQEQRIKNLENICENELSKNCIDGVEVMIFAECSTAEIKVINVTLNFKNLVIPDESMHININEQAKTIIANLLMVDKGVIIIE